MEHHQPQTVGGPKPRAKIQRHMTSGRSDAEVAGFVTDLTREYMDEVAEESC
jgi:hypothetical protein